jgi:hypothetical protein
VAKDTTRVAGVEADAGYLDSDPNLPRSPELRGPEMTPSRIDPGQAMTASATIPANELPSSSVLMRGKP